MRAVQGYVAWIGRHIGYCCTRLPRVHSRRPPSGARVGRWGILDGRELRDGRFAGSVILDIAAVLAGGVMRGVGSSAGEYNVRRTGPNDSKEAT